MIQPNELRLGNYVQDNSWHVVAKITAITESYIKYEDLDGRKYSSSSSKDYLQPIPLSDEWMDKFGFTHSKYSGFWRKGWFEVGYITTDEYPQLETEGGYLDIKSVHQLQNLYFALTGEELKLN